MKNFKKVLSLVLALSLLVSTMTISFAAADTTAEKADVLNALGLLNGVSTEEFDPALDVEANRQTAMVLLARAFGWELDEEATTDFEDVADWAVPAVAKAVELGVTEGMGEGVYGALEMVTARQVATWVARLLTGSETAWEDNADLDNEESVTRGGLVDVIWETLSQTPVGAEKSLIETIIGDDADLLAVAQEAGLVEVVTAFGVESVTATNLKTIVVKFNGEVDKDTVKASATAVVTDTVRVYNSTGALVNVTATLSEDKTEMYVVGANAFAQFSTHTLVVDGVKDTAAVAAEKSETSITFKDDTQPVVLGAVATSMKTIEITFSEPINGLTNGTSKVWSEFKIAGINTYATLDSSAINTENKISITLGTKLAAGDHVLTVSGLNDYAGFPVASTALTVTVAADTTAPAVASVEYVDNVTVKVNFNEPVDATTAGTATNYKVENVNPTSATKVDVDTYKLTLASALTLGTTVSAKLEIKGIKDNNDNAVADWTATAFTTTDDTVAPTATAAVTSDNKVEVTFSEAVTGVATGDFTFKNKDNAAVTVVSATAKTISGVVSETVYVVVLDGASTLSGNCTLELAATAVADKGVRSLANAKTTFTLAFNDKVAPEVTSVLYVNEAAATDIVSDADADDSKVTIYFNEAMDNATLVNTGNYILGNVVLTDLAGATVSAAADGRSVTITRDSDDATDVDFTVNSVLRVLALKDLNGNTLKSTQLNADLGSAGLGLIQAFNATPAFATAINTAKVEAVAKNQVKLYVNDGYLIAGVDPNKVTFEEADAHAISDLQVTGVAIAADQKSVVLTLNRDLTEDRKADAPASVALDADTTAEIVEIVTAADAITLTDGSKTLALATGTNVALVDKIAPTVKSILNEADTGAGNNIVVITYNEDIDMAASFLFDIVVKDVTAGTTLVPTTDFTVAEVANAVEVTIIKDGVANHSISVEVINGRYVTDVAGNASVAKAVSVVKKVDTTTDALMNEKVAPIVATDLGAGAPVTIAATTTATITFSETLSAAGKTAVEAALTAASANDGTYSWSGAVLTITGATGDTVYTGADVTATFTDLAGNSSGPVVIVDAN